MKSVDMSCREPSVVIRIQAIETVKASVDSIHLFHWSTGATGERAKQKRKDIWGTGLRDNLQDVDSPADSHYLTPSRGAAAHKLTATRKCIRSSSHIQ